MKLFKIFLLLIAIFLLIPISSSTTFTFHYNNSDTNTSLIYCNHESNFTNIIIKNNIDYECEKPALIIVESQTLESISLKEHPEILISNTFKIFIIIIGGIIIIWFIKHIKRLF